MERLIGKTAVVTGAGRGIGAATARLFAREGAGVVLAGRSAAPLDALRDEIEAGGGRALAVPTDVADEGQVQSLFRACLDRFGPVDVLVNNAAIIEVQELIDMDAATWDAVIATNLRGAFLCGREAFRQMGRGGHGGCVVNLGSLSGVRGPEKFAGFGAYVVSKYGVLGLTEIMAVEGKRLHIRVNCVSPGAVDTAMLTKAAPFLKTRTTPDDVARTVLSLADDAESRHVSGANIEIFSND